MPAEAAGAAGVGGVAGVAAGAGAVLEVAGLEAVLAGGAGVGPVDLRLDPGAVRATAAREPGGYRVEVVARSYAADVTLHADRLAADAVVDDALVTLLAGERATFHVSTDAVLDLADLTAAPVLRSANDLRGVPLAGAPDLEADLEAAR